jgi:hypothetical protein
LFREALTKYDADKTGLFDFALESAGGSIISTRLIFFADIVIPWLVLVRGTEGDRVANIFLLFLKNRKRNSQLCRCTVATVNCYDMKMSGQN